ncbi:hypothetical protein [Mesorhizobium sp. B2-8-5]|uniref:hypothetical protein n=1 Tax=Mesorhizobium sp. B2-8-5 TaxID=2589903 RepID=UPI0011285ECC|nr:hypothetical protein [Mesorhizobium sp. B2-8-5]UCI24588.1 hypothetical protein FJ430_23785 [Mesorhizobium sp. B2-8-5]
MPSTDVVASLGQTLIAAGTGALIANFIAELVKGLVRKSQALEAARDEDLSTLLKIVEEMQDLATEYWTATGVELGAREPVLRAKIVARQQLALELIAHLFKENAKRDCDVMFTKIMDVVGGDEFGEPDRAASPERLAAVYQYGMSFLHLAKKSRRGLKRGLLA